MATPRAPVNVNAGGLSRLGGWTPAPSPGILRSSEEHPRR